MTSRRQLVVPALALTLLIGAFAVYAHARNLALERAPRIAVTVTERSPSGCALRLQTPDGPRTAHAPFCPPDDHAWARALNGGPAPWAFEPIPPYYSRRSFVGLALLVAGLWAAVLTALRSFGDTNKNSDVRR